MQDHEFDNQDLIEESRGILQKFNMLFQTDLNEELQALLFQKMHRYTYSSVSDALKAIAIGSTSFQKPAELIGKLVTWLGDNGKIEPGDPMERENWWTIGAPVRVKAGPGSHPGWIYSSDMLTGTIFYRRNRISRGWICIYCPLFHAMQGDGPEMPGPVQSLAVRMILTKFPMPKLAPSEADKELVKSSRQIYDAWKRNVDRYILKMPWDNAKVQRELSRHYREKALGHPLEPRGWNDMKESDGGK